MVIIGRLLIVGAAGAIVSLITVRYVMPLTLPAASDAVRAYVWLPSITPAKRILQLPPPLVVAVLRVEAPSFSVIVDDASAVPDSDTNAVVAYELSAGDEITGAAGVDVSTIRALFAASELAAPGVGRVRVALFPARSVIVPDPTERLVVLT